MAIIEIIPKVKKYIDNGLYVKFEKLSIDFRLSDFQYELLSNFLDLDSNNKIIFKEDLSIIEGAYFINVYQDYIECIYSNKEGIHNAVCTLRQLLLNINKLTTCSIYDEPLFKVRSVMIDISRNKVPKLETLKEIARQLSMLKINDIQLYIEGRSFYYSFLDKFYDDKNNFMLPEEMLELYYYCKSIGITLTPNTNCFGHMAYWLNQPELSHLALKPEGFEFSENGTRGYAQTIDPDNEEAYDFVIKLLDEILTCFPECKRMTIGGDEPFELLFPTKDPYVKDIYLKQMSKIINYVKSKGITPCMWGDVVKEYPDTLECFKEAILLEWGYDAGHITEKNCKMYKEYNAPYMVCPGTSGWLTFAGRMENMIQNYKDAVINGGNNGAYGMVITDWNDGGSFSQLPTNLLSYAFGACYAWGDINLVKEDLFSYLDNTIFDFHLSKSIYSLGNYYLCQDSMLCNMTKLFVSFFSCQTDGINLDIKSYSDCNALSNNKNVLSYLEIEKTEKYIKDWFEKFDFINANQYVNELQFTYRLISHSLKLNYVYLQLMNVKNCEQELKFLLNDIKSLIFEYNHIWHYRNKKSDYLYSVKRLEILEFKYENLLKLMKI